FADSSIGQKRFECRIISQGGRTRETVRPDYLRRLRGSKVQTVQHQIKERGILTGTCLIESIQQSLTGALCVNVHVVQRYAAIKLRPFAADVARLERQVFGKLALNLQAKVLNVWIDTVIIETDQGVGPRIEALGREWLYGCRRARHRDW